MSYRRLGLQDVNVYSNYELGLAMRDAGYDYKLVIGTEAHNSKHGSAILPDALRWLWRDYPKPIARPRGSWIGKTTRPRNRS